MRLLSVGRILAASAFLSLITAAPAFAGNVFDLGEAHLYRGLFFLVNPLAAEECNTVHFTNETEDSMMIDNLQVIDVDGNVFRISPEQKLKIEAGQTGSIRFSQDSVFVRNMQFRGFGTNLFAVPVAIESVVDPVPAN